MSDHVLWESPVPSSQYDTRFHEGLGSSVVVSFQYDDGEGLYNASLTFLDVRSFTWSIREGMPDDVRLRAYSKLIDLGNTPRLRDIRAQGPRALKHLAVHFDGSGCYEAVCMGFRFESKKVETFSSEG